MPLSDSANVEATRSAPRALVYLTVDWSMPERESRQAFFEAVESLSGDLARLGISRHSLDEEAAAVRDFLVPLGFKQDHIRGSGTLLWPNPVG